MKPRSIGSTLGVVVAIGIGTAVAVVLTDSESDMTRARTPVDVASLGPQIGDQVPTFRLPDQDGEVRTLESISGPNGAMLLFHRSADW